MKDVNVIENLYVKRKDTHQYLDSSSGHCKKVSLTAKFGALIESGLVMPSLMRDVTN